MGTPVCLPEVPPPNTIMLGLGLQHEFWGDKHSAYEIKENRGREVNKCQGIVAEEVKQVTSS